MITRPLLFSYQSKHAWLAVLASVIALFGLYIFQVNSLTALAYLVSAQEGQIRQTKAENKALEMAALQSPGFEGFETLAKEFGFEKVGKVSYLKAFVEGVAAQSKNLE